MFRAIARLLFGGEEQTPDDFKSGEMAAEEWQVVSHQGQPEMLLLHEQLTLKTSKQNPSCSLIRF